MPRHRRLGQGIAVAAMVIGLLGLAFITYYFIKTPSLDVTELIKVGGLGLIVAGVSAALIAVAQMLTGGGRRKR